KRTVVDVGWSFVASGISALGHDEIAERSGLDGASEESGELAAHLSMIQRGTPAGLRRRGPLNPSHLLAGSPSKGTMLRLVFTILLTLPAGAQIVPGLTVPPSGGNQKASVTQHIGPVTVTIDYSSPAVHAPNGTDRRGQIWGKLVPYGLTDLGFGNGKPAPWRAGANENTVFTTSDPVLIESKPLPAGRYGLHMIAGPEEFTVIFSKDANAWGSFYYEAAHDALRV